MTDSGSRRIRRRLAVLSLIAFALPVSSAAATTPDAPALISGPDGLVNSDTATITFTGQDEAVFSCTLDGGPVSGCSSPAAYSDLPDGDHVFEVTQSDIDGNESAPLVVAWTIDTTPPDSPTITSLPATPTVLLSGSIAFEGEPGGSFRCSLDAAPATLCSSPLAFGPLITGNHSLSVFQVDEAGNQGAPTTANWTILGPPPTPPPGAIGVTAIGGIQVAGTQRVFNTDVVALRVIWPLGARTVTIANRPDFVGSTTYPVTQPIKWTLANAAAGNTGTTRIYARFQGDSPVDPLRAYRNAIRFDRARPVLQNAFLSRRDGSAPYRWTIVVSASDRGTGLKTVRVWRSVRPPHGRTGDRTLLIAPATRQLRFPGKPGGSRPTWIQVEDRVGNRSDWQLIR